MSIRLSINGTRLDDITITNRGPIDGKYAEGDEPGGPGVRWYEWNSPGGSGFVLHRRDDGAHALAAAVLNEIHRAKTYPKNGSCPKVPNQPEGETQ